MNQSSFALYCMSTRRCHPRLRVAVDLIAHARRLAGLRIDNLHVRNIEPGFAIDDAAATITRRFLVTLDDARAFDFDLALVGCNGQHAATLALITARNHDHLIVLPKFGSFSSLQLFTSYSAS